MGATMSERLSQLGYVKARRLLVAAGLLVLAVVVVTMLARRVDTVEVLATILFVPIFLAFVFLGVVGGLVAAVGAIVAYAALRSPAIDAVGVSEFAGLLVSRSAAYLIFGAVGGWSTHVLESSLHKLELYDEIDDETGLYNARHLLHQTDLERARATRYQTLFSVVRLDVPSAPISSLRGRRRGQLLRDLGRQVNEGVRSVDHVVHAHEGGQHRFAAILPETGREGADVFRRRFEDRIVGFLAEHGASVEGGAVSSALTFPGDEAALDEVRALFGRIDAMEHKSAIA